MPNTMLEKIFLRHGAESCGAGDIVWLGLDYRTARDFGGASVVKHLRQHFPQRPVADVSRTFFTFDCNAPANTAGYADNQHACRLFAREFDVQVYDVDAGIGSHVLLESGLIGPGSTAVGTDSHYNILGAVGALGQGMGDADIAFAFAHGKTWFEVPPSVKLHLTGMPSAKASAKDVTLYVVGQLGASGLLGEVADVYGPWVEQADLASRITLASMGTEMGAISLLLPGADPAWQPDADAVYAREITIDLTGLQPVVALPGKPDNVHAGARRCRQGARAHRQRVHRLLHQRPHRGSAGGGGDPARPARQRRRDVARRAGDEAGLAGGAERRAGAGVHGGRRAGQQLRLRRLRQRARSASPARARCS